MKRVVITGAGTINALGHTVGQTLQAMREGTCGICLLEVRDIERLSVQIGGQIKGYNPDQVFNRQQLSLYDRFTQLTLIAAKEAVAQSGLEFAGALSAKSGVFWVPQVAGYQLGMIITVRFMRVVRTGCTPLWFPN